MKTLIFEGIATSGKSTMINRLVSALPPEIRVKVVPETETIMAIIDNTDMAMAIAHIQAVLDQAYAGDSDLVIFDRLYLTHIFRTSSDITQFKAIETRLKPYAPLTIFLKVDEEAIANRVERAAQHRDPEWKEYIFTKGTTLPEIAQYYIEQQQSQQNSLEQSILPYKIFNTTDHEYDTILDDILRNLDI